MNERPPHQILVTNYCARCHPNPETGTRYNCALDQLKELYDQSNQRESTLLKILNQLGFDTSMVFANLVTHGIAHLDCPNKDKQKGSFAGRISIFNSEITKEFTH